MGTESLSPGVKLAGLALITLGPRLKKEYRYTYIPPLGLHTYPKVTFTFHRASHSYKTLVCRICMAILHYGSHAVLHTLLETFRKVEL